MLTMLRSTVRVHRTFGLFVLAAMLVVAIGAATFASGSPGIATVTVDAQVGALTEGTAGSATYFVTVANGDSSSTSAALSIAWPGGEPAGVTASFAPPSVDPSVGGTSTLTIDTTGSTPAAATGFTVTATDAVVLADTAEGSGTVTVDAPPPPPAPVDQTITFDPVPNKTLVDSGFTVTATASSGLAVSFAATGDCSVDGAGVVTLTGIGSCTITASQAGNGSFNPAPDVVQTFDVLSAPATIFHLYAKAGTTTLPGAVSMPVWGYTATNTLLVQPGGPAIVVEQGAPVTLRLHNQLVEATSLLINGQGLVPDRTGAAAGSFKDYTFTPSNPGTFLYEAGLRENAQHQTAMGLYGTLIVRPTGAPNQAYDGSTSFDDEGVLLLSEIDPALNNSANPADFDMRHYKPTYFLINGKASPDTDPIATTAGNTVLLRYVNAGIQYHSMALLGARQKVVALDGSKLNYARHYVAETFGPGQTTDVIVATAASSATRKLPIYDGNLLLHNSSAAGAGGMLTFLTVTGGAAAAAGPITSNVAYAGTALTATVDDTATGGDNISAAEYFIDGVGAPGSGTLMSGSFGAVSASVSSTVTVGDGPHVIYVRGKDSAGNWGVVSSVLVNGGDIVGPAVTSQSLDPNPANGTTNVVVHATADDSAAGGSNIADARYRIGGGPSATMTIGAPTVVTSVAATIPAATANGLAEGTHVISIQAKDSAGNWGPEVTASLLVDKTGPTTSTVVATPNPNNGSQPVNASSQAVRVTAGVTDVLSKVTRAEGFLDAVGANGTGFVFAASDGAFNSNSESVYVDIPLATIWQLSTGPHTISVHGRDAAGNWGLLVTTTLTKTPGIGGGPPPAPIGPEVVPPPAPAGAPAPPVAGATRLFFATSGVSNPPGVGGKAGNADIYRWTKAGFKRVIDASAVPYSLPAGAIVDGFVRIDPTSFYMSFGNPTTRLAGIGAVQDEDVVYYKQGTWSVVFDGTAHGLGGSGKLDVDAINVRDGVLYFSTVGARTPPGVAGNGDSADVYRWQNGRFARVFDASRHAVPGGSNVDGFVRVDAHSFYMSFASGTTRLPGVGTVEDEDVVYYDKGAWFLYFDGTARGLTKNTLDVRAFDVG